MNTDRDDSDTVTVGTVDTVTLTQDTEGNFILHCPQNDVPELNSSDSGEPPRKRLCLSSEDEQSLDESAPCISVVAVPIPDNNQSFEVTMAAASEVADEEIGEGTVTQIQILQNEEQIEGLSPSRSEAIAPVSQAWFTTKEDKDSLTNKGHKWKQGMWSKEEIDILMSNIDNYLKEHGIKDAAEIIFEMSKDERKDFYRTIACGLNRPLFAVYRRVLRMYDNRNHVGKYTPAEIERLKELRMKYGNDWATIGASLGRSASSVKDRCRLMKDTCNTGKWTEEEEKRLAKVVHELTCTEPGDIVTQGVSWASVAELVGSRSEKQCRSKWLNYLNWKQSGGTEWTKDDEINLIMRISELGVSDENDINWDLMAEGWSSVRSPQWLRSKWWTIKRQITNHKEVSFHASSESPAVTGDTETITLNTGALQTFEILPSFHLQPTGTPGTYLLQTGSSQGLPLTLTSPTVTLTSAASPSSPEQIIVHALSPEHLLNTNDSVTVQMSHPSVIIHTVAADDITSSITQAELTVDGSLGHSDLSDHEHTLDADSFTNQIQEAKLNEDALSPCSTNGAHSAQLSNKDSTELIHSIDVSIDGDISAQNLKQNDEVHSDLTSAYVREGLESPTMVEQVDQSAIDESVIIVPSSHEFIRSSDDIDSDSVLPLTTLTDPILQHQGEGSNIIGSSLNSPISEDSKDNEDLEGCH
ncbi:cyclin-D-binding Myb-like transcription factor 1 isoform X2 [Protopterus annectens]|uniref:cyclin-D-binding Myb-like transcription factor 1 isoform X2 n=1 Tax=Protopterus annectens TaxID=7888 RepID=UPI001CFB401B|nr:cyclin-D-binding Myb-like transcription factor 1 isoform X2 [Protopterus annectens]